MGLCDWNELKSNWNNLELRNRYVSVVKFLEYLFAVILYNIK